MRAASHLRFCDVPVWCRITSHSLLLVLGISCAAGCRTMNQTQQGAIVGTGVGTAAGAIIGHQSGNAVGGAIVGAATGALAGGLVGRVGDVVDERDAAIAQASYLEAEQKALNNADVLMMVQSGLSDELVIASIRRTYGKYDLSPQAMVDLKHCGLSDRVLLAMEQSTPVPPPAMEKAVVGKASVAGPPTTIGVIVAPRPRFIPHPHHSGPHWHPGPPRRY
ncbi:MAG: hypothetical protein C0478_03320 [Planctomyces sp.]|nr:hypothetical protein [Planctomyces sp.]